VGLTGSERAEQLPINTLIDLSRRLAAELDPDRDAASPTGAVPSLTTSSIPRA
jgi:hypothetical protein